MANKVVLFPAGKEAECQTYRDWTDAQFAILAPGEGGFTYARVDAYGQSAAPYLGPPFEWPVGTPTAEPGGGEAMRIEGVLVDMVTWVIEGQTALAPLVTTEAVPAPSLGARMLSAVKSFFAPDPVG